MINAVNNAHQLERRAEAHLLRKHFDESIQCYQKAAEKLKEAEQRSNDEMFLRSVKYQQERCIQLQKVISMKKNQYIADKTRQQKMIQVLTKLEQTSDERNQEASNLQRKIYRTMEEADSLLEQLVRLGGESDGDELESVKSDNIDGACGGEDTVQVDASEPAKLEGSKWPKDDRTVIEELRTLNHQLRSLVVQLLTQLDASCKEAEMLRERVRFLEGERRVKSDDVEGRISVPVVRKSSLHVITDSTGGSSPFVYSPCSELSPDVPTDTPHIVTRELPVLAPLEMPDFDFGQFKKQTSVDHSPIS
ncbi:nuclear receptor-binding factor 2 isoform X3 [Cryptotermes secundus]|uniref:nuclear receptor-binding factor 2 isoform X3 n=1 Tax=Cryptotermes secundus TaxID=105785 RepID=UPI000CD7D74D|nr:nuclear receptor-binding factor 2 isoform X3 [Cryptotermes secundus]